jgi:uncharacterized protein
VATLGPDVERLIDEQRLCFVATVNEDGTPNLSPKGTIVVLDSDHLAFGDIRSPQTIRNLRARPGIEINVIDPLSRRGYRFRGAATVHEDGPQFEQLLAILQARGTRNPIQAVVVVRVERADPVLSPAYDAGASEDEIREQWRTRQAALEGER